MNDSVFQSEDAQSKSPCVHTMYENDFKKKVVGSNLRVSSLKLGLAKDWEKDFDKTTKIPFLKQGERDQNLENVLKSNEPNLPKIVNKEHDSSVAHQQSITLNTVSLNTNSNHLQACNSQYSPPKSRQ